MSKVTGIIAEFNPFHNGHKRLLNEAQGTTVIVMSGNWMQRGEPAFIDKWTRAEMALINGADLVVELPFMGAVQGADFFAQGAVEILRELGVNEILFGSELEIDYQKLAETYAEKAEEMQAYLASLPDWISYPIKAEKMWTAFAGIQFDGGTPNHVLGLAYAKAVKDKQISLRTMKRDTGYNDTTLKGKVASATAIRENLAEAKSFVPENTWKLLQSAPKASWSDFWELLRYKIMVTGDLTKIYQVNEELSQRIRSSIKTASNLDELISQVYTKRYTKGHIRRLLTYILLDIPREAKLPKGIHVLGFTDNGQRLLAQARKNEVPIVTRIGQYPWDALTQKADEIYRLGNLEIPEQAYAKKPIIKNLS